MTDSEVVYELLCFLFLDHTWPPAVNLSPGRVVVVLEREDCMEEGELGHLDQDQHHPL